jgi:hypothetical protein
MARKARVPKGPKGLFSKKRIFWIVSALVLGLIVIVYLYSFQQAETALVKTERVIPIVDSFSLFDNEKKHIFMSYYLGFIKGFRPGRNPSVLQIESSPSNESALVKFLNNIENSGTKVIYQDARDTKTAPYGLINNTTGPFMYVVLHSELMTNSDMMKFAPLLSNSFFSNVGFLFVGFSLNNNCPSSDQLLDYDESVLGWSKTIRTRITFTMTVC